MCVHNRLELVSYYLRDHLNEPKPLSLWYNEINNSLTKNRRLTLSEMAFLFSYIRRKGLLRHDAEFIVERKSKDYVFMEKRLVVCHSQP